MASTQLTWQTAATFTAPLWTVEPDISLVEAICRHHLFPDADSLAVDLTVKFLAQGAFNKVYAVDTERASTAKSYIFRVTLPVDPGDKVRNEVATLDYVKQHTEIPVPTVIAYDSSSHNALGFEWILMDKIPGAPLKDIWSRLSDTSKAAITRQIASYVVQMRKNCVFHGIGGLYHGSDDEFIIGPIVTQSMFMNGRRLLVSRNRGPYHHGSDYARALVDLQITDIHLLETMRSDDPNFDEDLFEDGPAMLDAMDGLLSLLPTIFPKDKKNEPVRAPLVHPDLSLSNIMVDPDIFEITGIIDWECTNASPQWQGTYPQFLTGPDLEEEPARLETGDINCLRNELREDWEKMQLRAVFDEVAGPLMEEPLAELKRDFIYYLEGAAYSQFMTQQWIQKTKENILSHRNPDLTLG